MLRICKLILAILYVFNRITTCFAQTIDVNQIKATAIEVDSNTRGVLFKDGPYMDIEPSSQNREYGVNIHLFDGRIISIPSVERVLVLSDEWLFTYDYQGGDGDARTTVVRKYHITGNELKIEKTITQDDWLRFVPMYQNSANNIVLFSLGSVEEGGSSIDRCTIYDYNLVKIKELDFDDSSGYYFIDLNTLQDRIDIVVGTLSPWKPNKFEWISIDRTNIDVKSFSFELSEKYAMSQYCNFNNGKFYFTCSTRLPKKNQILSVEFGFQPKVEDYLGDFTSLENPSGLVTNRTGGIKLLSWQDIDALLEMRRKTYNFDSSNFPYIHFLNSSVILSGKALVIKYHFD